MTNTTQSTAIESLKSMRDMKLLQDAEDSYYLSVDYLLNLSSRAKELFESSEPQEKRQLIKLVLQNLGLEGGLVRYDYLNPFSKIAEYADRSAWLPLVNIFRNREVEFGFSLGNIKTVFESFQIQIL